MIPGRLIHSCTIETNEATTGTADAYGQYATNVTSAASACLFTNGGKAQKLESGTYAIDIPSAILPATAVVKDGDVLTGVSTGWARKYVVKGKPRTVWNRVGVDHIEVDLEASA